MSIPVLQLPQISLPSESLLRNEQINSLQTQQEVQRQQMNLNQQEAQRRSALQQLMREAQQNPQALQALSVVSPEAAKNIQDYQNNQAMIVGRAAMAFKMADRSNKPQIYQRTIKQLISNGIDVSDLPAEYDPDDPKIVNMVNGAVDFAINNARDIEKQIGTRQIIETQQGVFTVDPMTGQSIPVQTGKQTLQPYSTPATQINIGDLNKTMTKVDEKVIEKSFEAQTAAEETLPALQRAEALLESISTSPALPYKAKAQTVGSILSGGVYKPQSLSDFQELDSISKELGARTLQLFGGSDTEKELEVAIKTTINPSDLSQANINRVNRKIQAAKILQAKPEMQIEWINNNGSILKKDAEGNSFSQKWRDYQKTEWENSVGKKQLVKPAKPVKSNLQDPLGIR